MRKIKFGRLIFAVIVGLAMSLAVLTACDRTPGAETVYYTVTFDSRGGSEVPSQKIENGKTAQKPADPAREGYTFEGWFDGETEYDFTKAVEKNFTLSAKWTEVPAASVYYTVRFMNGSSEYKSVEVESGKTAQKPADPVKSGYAFKEWILPDGKAYDFTKAVTADIALYATWTKKTEIYTVRFMDGANEYMSAKVESGKPAQKPADPVKNGYAFKEWILSDGTAYDFTKTVTSDMTLYATWNKIQTPETVYYTVTFDSGVTAQQVEQGKKAVEPEAPEKEGYVFAGWYLSGAPYDFNTAVNADITLTAKWVEGAPATYTVTFDANGGSDVLAQEIVSGGKAVKPAAPEKDGYVFAGWYIGETPYDFDNAVTENITLTAKWTEAVQVYVVTFDSDGGSKVSAQEVERDGKAARPKDPVKDGYAFAGWYLGETQYNFDARVTADITLKAKWSKNSVTPPAAPTLSVPEIPADATIINVGASETYKTVTAALEYAKTLPASDIKVIEIADGEYKEKLTISTPNVWLIGSDLPKGESLSATRNNGVIIWYDDIAGTAGGTDKSASVTVNATDFTAINITFKNYYNTHELYLDSLEISSSTQAVALAVNADRAGFYNCKVTSYHDTLLANRGMQLYYNCWIEGRTDYVFGQNAIAYFENCDIWTIGAGDKTNGGYVVAQKPSTSDYYYVFNNCRFDGDGNVTDDTVALGRPWGAEMKMVVMNSYISGKYSKKAHTAGTTAGQRYCTMSNVDPDPTKMLEYNNTGEGAIDASIANTCTYMTEADAAAYSLRNVLTLNGWNVTGDKQDLITFGTSGNYKEFYDKYGGNGTISGTANVGDNGADNSQVKEGYLEIKLIEGALITISSFQGYTNYTVTINGGTPSEVITDTSWKYVASGDETIVITAATSSNYFYYISILY